MTAAGFLTFVIYMFVEVGSRIGQLPGEYMTILIARIVIGIGLLVGAAFTFARRIPGAWTLFVFALLAIPGVLLEPMLIDAASFGSFIEFLFKFRDWGYGALAVAGILAVVTAVLAVLAAILKAKPPQQRYQQPQYQQYQQPPPAY